MRFSDRIAALPAPWHHRWFWVAQAAGWSLYLTGNYLSAFAAHEPGDPDLAATLPIRVVRVAFAFVLSSLLALALLRLPDLRTGPRRLVVGTVVGAGVAGMIWYPAYRYASHPWRTDGSVPLSQSCLVPCLLDHMWLMLAWGVLFVGINELRRASAREQEALHAARLASEARYQMLVYQVNPHFLFNALNSVRALIAEDVGRAREMITKLAAFLRHTLVSRPLEAVSLRDELAAVEAYLSVEQVRHESALVVQFDVTPDAAAAALPGFLVHPLVENALTHGFATPHTTLRLIIRARRDGDLLVVEVVNSGHLQSSRRDGMGIGLRNIRERLAHLYAGRGTLTLTEHDGHVTARLVLPAAESARAA